MNGIVITLDPTIVRVGRLALRWYGLFVALAILTGVWLALREAARKGLDVARVQTLAMWAVPGGFVGARLVHVVDRWDLYAAAPLRALAISDGGLAVYGGLIGGALVGLAYALRHGLSAWRLADTVAPGMLLGQAVGRLACIPNGDAYGTPARLPWAFVYTNPLALLPRHLLGVPLHPYPVYEMLFDLALLGVLWRLRPVLRTDGLVFLTYAGLYAIGRFILTYYRAERVWVWGLQEAQVIALLVALVALPLLAWRWWAGGRRSAAAPRRPPTIA